MMKFRILPKDEKQVRKSLKWNCITYGMFIAMYICIFSMAGLEINTLIWQEHPLLAAQVAVILFLMITFIILRNFITASLLLILASIILLNELIEFLNGDHWPELLFAFLFFYINLDSALNTYMLRKWKREANNE